MGKYMSEVEGLCLTYLITANRMVCEGFNVVSCMGFKPPQPSAAEPTNAIPTQLPNHHSPSNPNAHTFMSREKKLSSLVQCNVGRGREEKGWKGMDNQGKEKALKIY